MRKTLSLRDRAGTARGAGVRAAGLEESPGRRLERKVDGAAECGRVTLRAHCRVLGFGD